MASSWTVGMSAFVIFSLHSKTQKMACITPWAPSHEWVNIFSGTADPGCPGQRAIKWLLLLLLLMPHTDTGFIFLVD